MRSPFIPNISLANKCRLLFGAAVLLILAATLFVPWVQLTGLNTDLHVRSAERIATAAVLLTDITGQDWVAAQTQLNQRWPAYARQLGFPTNAPTLVSTDQATLRGKHGFIPTATQQLQAAPTSPYYWEASDKDGNPVLKFALAVRAGETESDPGVLKGIIDVRLPMQGELGTWNTIVVVASGVCGGLAALLVFYLVTQKLILSPVRHLRRVAEQVTSGDLDTRSDVSTRDEFQDLSDAFNDMLVHLQASHEELRTINCSLDARVGELAETNVALYESNRLKSELLANVSHELRTPLVSIIGFAELLRDAQADPPKDRDRLMRYADNILTSGRSLLDMINDLLDLAKIEAGKLELHVSQFDLADVCQSLRDFVQPLADKRNQALDLTLAPNLPRMHSDSGKVKQILYNLLSNALKFTPAGGRIVLTAEPGTPSSSSASAQSAGADAESNETVRLAVSDTGPGIPEDQHATIFEQFKQIDASVTREHGGSGLGLAITKELALLLGGTIDMESTVGEGSTFTVTLPLRAPGQDAGAGKSSASHEQPCHDTAP